MTLSTGFSLNNRYRIVSVLGQGGMGAVYRAVDENLGVEVAVKENLFLSDEYARQFQLEASILANLRHPNLPRVGDYFVIHGQGQYLVMDYIDGEDLRQRLERLNCLPESEVVIIGAVICEALTYLHTRQPSVIHRDIKPGNIKVTPDGEIYLVDFGLAKVMGDSQATTNGARAMTPGYSPPEQYGIARTDPRSDIYSLGATLYAALTGIIPEDSLARATGKARLTSLSRLQPRLNKRIATVIEKALEVEMDDRFQTAEEFKQALLEAGEISQLSIGNVRIQPPPPVPSPLKDQDNAKIDGRSPEIISNPVIKPVESTTDQRVKARWLTIFLITYITSLGAAFFLIPGLSSGLPSFRLPAVIGQFLSPTNIPTQQISATNTMTIPMDVSSITARPSPTLTPSITASSTPSPTPTPTFTSSPTPIPSDTPRPTATLWGGSSNDIAFASNSDGSMQIWLMNTEGSNFRKLTSLIAGACQPAWSPDGNQLAFINPCKTKKDLYEGAQIYTMNADGSDIKPLPVPKNPQGDFDPAWSPKGKQIAFTSLRSGSPRILLYDLEKNALIQVSQSRFVDRDPTWSPDGTHIAYVRQFLVRQLWMTDITDWTEEQLSPNSAFDDIWPDWAPDGQTVYYCQVQPGSNPFLVKLGVQNNNFGQERRVLPPGPDISFPIASAIASPDSNWLIFESWPDGINRDIYMMDIYGSNLRRLTTSPAFDFSPAWRPVIKKP